MSTSLSLRRPSFILAASVAGLLALGTARHAAGFTVQESAAAPTTNILASQLTDSSGTLIGNQDFTDNGGPPGQTFTLGGSGNFQLQTITILGGNNTGSASGVNWSLQIGSVNTTTGAISQLDLETAIVSFTKANDYLTFQLSTPVTLAAGTTYAFSLFSANGYYGLAHSAGDVYAGGSAFNNDTTNAGAGNTSPTRTFNGFVSPRAYDYVFALQGGALTAAKTFSGSNGSDFNGAGNFSGLTFAAGDNVIFGDTAANGTTPVTNRNVTISSGTVAPGVNFTINNSAGDYTFTGGINGTTNATLLTKSGTSNATLAGTTDNPGLSALVNGGTLILGKTATSSTIHAVSALTVTSGGTAQLAGSGGDQIADSAIVTLGGTLDLNGNSEGFDVLTGTTGGLVTNNSSTGSNLTLGTNNGSNSFPGVISNGTAGGTIFLVKTGTGTQTLTGQSTFTGGVVVNSGTLALGFGGVNGTLAAGSDVTVTTGGTLRLNVTDALGYGGGTVHPVSLNGGTMTAAAGTHSTLPGISLTGGTLAALGPGNAGGASSYIFDGDIVSHASATLSTISASVNLRGGVAAAAPVVFNVEAGPGPVDLSVTGSLSDSGQGLTKLGAGVLALSGTNTYTGATTISAGVVSASSAQAFGTGPIALNGGTLRLAGFRDAVSVNFNGGTPANPAGVTVTGTAGVVPTANFNNIPGLSDNGAPFSLQDAAGTPNFATLSFNAPATYLSGSTNPLLNGYLDNITTGSVETVTVANLPFTSYSVYAYFGSDVAGRTGTVNLGSTTYSYSSRGNVTDFLQTTDVGSGNPLANYAVFSGVTGSSVTLNQMRGSGNGGLMGLQIVQDGMSALTVANVVNLTADSTIDVTGASGGTLSGALTVGTNQLTVTGGSTGANAPFALALGSVGGVTLTGSPIFNVANNGTGQGTVTLNQAAESGASRSVSKTGAGTLVLAGSNTWSGDTSVLQGVLTVSGSLGGTARVTVASGATLSGDGSLNVSTGQVGTPGGYGNVTLAAGAKLAPGTAPQRGGTLILSLNTLDLSSALAGHSGALQFNLDTPSTSSKALLTSGSLTLGTGLLDFGDFQFTLGSGFAPGVYTLFDSSSAISGSFDSVAANRTGLLNGYQATLGLADSGHDVVLTVAAVPEPGALLSLLTGGTLLTGLARFRRRV